MAEATEGTGEKMVFTGQKEASCPSQPQGMGTSSPLELGSEDQEREDPSRSQFKMCEATSLRTGTTVHQLLRPLTNTGWQACL